MILVLAATGSAEPTAHPTAEEAERGVGMDQILPYDLNARSGSSMPDQIDAVRAKAGNEAGVSQLPDDIEIIDKDGKGPEQAIVRPVDSPEARLYSQVAEVWEVIRQRGQQPTPELIAREIGPDALASFLDQNPGAESIFGRDSDNLPLPSPDGLDLPGGGTLILPPTDGGGG